MTVKFTVYKVTNLKNGKSEALKGKRKGIPLSEEHKRKISEASLKREPRNFSANARYNMSQAHIGVPLSEEHKKAISMGRRRHD